MTTGLTARIRLFANVAGPDTAGGFVGDVIEIAADQVADIVAGGYAEQVPDSTPLGSAPDPEPPEAEL